MAAWWTDNFFGVWLGVGHAIVAVILASASAWFVYHGQRRALVTRTLTVMSIFGAVCLAASILAVLQGQHFRVWYPLAMMGGISILTWLPNLMGLDWLYRRHDARRLAAEELRRS